MSDTKGNLVDGAAVNVHDVALLLRGARVRGRRRRDHRRHDHRGTATVTYCGEARAGHGTITAAVEDAFDTVLITVF